MMKKTLHIALIVFIVCCLDYSTLISETITLALKKSSVEYQEWITAGRKGEISSLTGILGKHIAKPYVRDEILVLMSRKSSSNSLNKRVNQQIAALERLITISLKPNIDASFIARKLSSLPFVEFVETAPIHQFIEIPNDPYYSVQSYLQLIDAEKAWDIYNNSLTKDSVLISIVDTGIDPLHEDFQGALFRNSGEYGKDSLGRDRASNGIDDDNNGFIDDFCGWDFASSLDQVKGDNTPYPGHLHGTHVAGIAAAVSNNEKGIAGIARNMKILPVKVGYDDTNSLSVSGSYEGVLYAAVMGADIINCSWGSPSRSKAEEEIISTALQYGCIIIGGAGNDGIETAFYPASYPGVISVAAISYDDVKTSYSNYNSSVDISAPGSFIYSSVLGNSYGYLSGTSMAAPVVTGVIALLKSMNPTINSEELAAIIKAGSKPIDSVNPSYRRMLGAGKLNAVSALHSKNASYVAIMQKQFNDQNNDGMFSPGEVVTLTLTAKNVLNALDSVAIHASVDTANIPLEFLKDSIFVGPMEKGTLYSLSQTIQFRLPDTPPYNYPLKVFLNVYSGNRFISGDIAELTINPTYRTLTENDIGVTINSIGNIGYNDYPENAQGIGFTINNDENSVLFEGGFIAGVSAEQLSSSVRDISGNKQEQSFYIEKPITLTIPGILARAETTSSFGDLSGMIDAGIAVNHGVYQFDEDSVKQSVFLVYDLQNRTSLAMDSLYAGLFFDWDIGPAGQDNVCSFNNANGFAYAYNTLNSAYPRIGVALLTKHDVNYYAIDNDGIGESFSIYDGFSRNEKWNAISGGVSREFSRSTDASMVISAGPISVEKGNSERIGFVVSAGNSESDLEREIYNARAFAAMRNIAAGFVWKENPSTTQLIDVGISLQETLSIDYQLSSQGIVEFSLYSITGEFLKTIDSFQQQAGIHNNQTLTFSGLPSGVYFIRMKAGGYYDALPFVISR